MASLWVGWHRPAHPSLDSCRVSLCPKNRNLNFWKRSTWVQKYGEARSRNLIGEENIPQPKFPNCLLLRNLLTAQGLRWSSRSRPRLESYTTIVETLNVDGFSGIWLSKKKECDEIRTYMAKLVAKRQISKTNSFWASTKDSMPVCCVCVASALHVADLKWDRKSVV